MIDISTFIHDFPLFLQGSDNMAPWFIPASLSSFLPEVIKLLGDEYTVHNDIALHRTAVIETGAIIKGPAIIEAGCFVAAHAYLRGGVYIGSNVVIGPGCEVKSSTIMSHTHLAHFNFVGDSIVGHDVNFEAGAIICNRWNERADKHINLFHLNARIETGLQKFGAIVGDQCKIGANAVLSPGTILQKETVIKRLELVEQYQ